MFSRPLPPETRSWLGSRSPGWKPRPIVLDGQFEGIRAEAERDECLGRSGMLDDIMEGFLEGEKEVVADLGGERPKGELLGEVQAATDARGAEEIEGELLQVVGQAFDGVVPGVDGPDDFIHRAGQLAGGVVDAHQAGAGLGGPIELAAGRFAEHGNPSKVGAEVVVDVAGDAGALSLDGALALADFQPAAQAAAAH